MIKHAKDRKNCLSHSRGTANYHAHLIMDESCGSTGSTNPAIDLFNMTFNVLDLDKEGQNDKGWIIHLGASCSVTSNPSMFQGGLEKTHCFVFTANS